MGMYFPSDLSDLRLVLSGHVMDVRTWNFKCKSAKAASFLGKRMFVPSVFHLKLTAPFCQRFPQDVLLFHREKLVSGLGFLRSDSFKFFLKRQSLIYLNTNAVSVPASPCSPPSLIVSCSDQPSKTSVSVPHATPSMSSMPLPATYSPSLPAA